MIRNTSGNTWRVFAFRDTAPNISQPVLGDAANITANLDIDVAGVIPVADTNPVETEDGYYNFDLTQAETNGAKLDLYPESATAGVTVIGVPGTVYTTSTALAATFPSETFTSLEEIQRIFSINGVDNHTEDYVDDTDLLAEIVNRATEVVLQFLRGRFDLTLTAQSPWIRMHATHIACYFLSMRRGNPSIYGDLYQEAMLDLAAARDGLINIGVPAPLRALVQTPMLDSRFFHPLRTNPSRSTVIYPGQRLPYRMGNYE